MLKCVLFTEVLHRLYSSDKDLVKYMQSHFLLHLIKIQRTCAVSLEYCTPMLTKKHIKAAIQGNTGNQKSIGNKYVCVKKITYYITS